MSSNCDTTISVQLTHQDPAIETFITNGDNDIFAKGQLHQVREGQRHPEPLPIRVYVRIEGMPLILMKVRNTLVGIKYCQSLREQQ